MCACMARSVPTRAEILDPIGYRIEQRRTWAWARLERLAEKAKSEMVRYLCLNEILKRTDPVMNQAQINAQFTGPVKITWKMPAGLNSPSSSPARDRLASTNGSHGSTSSSATGDSGKPSWL